MRRGLSSPRIPSLHHISRMCPAKLKKIVVTAQFDMIGAQLNETIPQENLNGGGGREIDIGIKFTVECFARICSPRLVKTQIGRIVRQASTVF